MPLVSFYPPEKNMFLGIKETSGMKWEIFQKD